MNALKQVIRKSFTDFDALTEALHGWNLELHKLDASPFSGEFFQLISSELILSRGRFNSRLRQVGEPPRGFRTFGILGEPDQRILWRGKHVVGNDLVLFPPNSELHASTETGFHIFTISIRESALHTAGEQLQMHDLEKRLSSREIFRCEPRQISLFRKSLETACIEHENTPALNSSVTSQQIAMHLIQLLAMASRRTLQQPTPLRREVIRKVDQHIFQHAEEPPTIPDLCAATNVSKRTLEYSFNEYYGMNPKAYINAVRLNAVRKQLRAAKTGNLFVADAANAWGFWHMGQFAHDYRKLFGENPSTTLGCAAKPCKPDCTFKVACQCKA